MGEAEKKAAYKKDKRDKARLAKKDRKKAAMGKKVTKNLLEQMIFPKIVQCSAIDLKLNTQVRDDDAWAWAEEMSDAYAQDVLMRIGFHPCRVLHQRFWNIEKRTPTSSRASTLWLRDPSLAKKC